MPGFRVSIPGQSAGWGQCRELPDPDVESAFNFFEAKFMRQKEVASQFFASTLYSIIPCKKIPVYECC